MLMLYLKKKGWLNLDEVSKELNILLDNCGGQNKNNFVLCLANLLVKCKYFKSVNFIFYVKGHTKNPYDCFFNLLKKEYRMQNIFTFEDLLERFRTSPKVTVNTVTKGDFRDW